MKRGFWVLVALGALCGHAAAGEIDIQIDNFTMQGNIAEVVMKVTNNTGRDVSNVFIDCAFLDSDKRAIDIGKAMIPAIATGGYAYDKASAVTGEGIEFADCRVTRVR